MIDSKPSIFEDTRQVDFYLLALIEARLTEPTHAAAVRLLYREDAGERAGGRATAHPLLTRKCSKAFRLLALCLFPSETQHSLRLPGTALQAGHASQLKQEIAQLLPLSPHPPPRLFAALPQNEQTETRQNSNSTGLHATNQMFMASWMALLTLSPGPTRRPAAARCPG